MRQGRVASRPAPQETPSNETVLHAGACSLASHIVLEWLGKPYETHKLSRDELKGPEFLKINPLGAVPALADGDWTLTQNVAILEYRPNRPRKAS